MGCTLFHPPIFHVDRSLTTFGSFLAFITKFFTIFSYSSRSSGYLSKFSNFSRPSRPSDETCQILNQFIQFTSLEISGIFSSIPIQHLSNVTTPSSIHVGERIQRRNLYVVNIMTGLLHKYGPRPTWCLTTRKKLQSNIWIGRC